jgi:parallel beta-helix repeat protein
MYNLNRMRIGLLLILLVLLATMVLSAGDIYNVQVGDKLFLIEPLQEQPLVVKVSVSGIFDSQEDGTASVGDVCEVYTDCESKFCLDNQCIVKNSGETCTFDENCASGNCGTQDEFGEKLCVGKASTGGPCMDSSYCAMSLVCTDYTCVAVGDPEIIELNSCKKDDWENNTIYKLTENITVGAKTCFEFNNVENVTLDCDDHKITGFDPIPDDDSKLGPGIILYSSKNMVVKNCEIRNFASGISMTYSDNNLIYNNTIRDNCYYNSNGVCEFGIGVSFSGSLNNNISNNYICGNGFTNSGYSKDLWGYPSSTVGSGNIMFYGMPYWQEHNWPIPGVHYSDCEDHCVGCTQGCSYTDGCLNLCNNILASPEPIGEGNTICEQSLEYTMKEIKGSNLECLGVYKGIPLVKQTSYDDPDLSYIRYLFFQDVKIIPSLPAEHPANQASIGFHPSGDWSTANCPEIKEESDWHTIDEWSEFPPSLNHAISCIEESNGILLMDGDKNPLYIDSCQNISGENVCFDNIDNDDDGLVDCADSDCATESYCEVSETTCDDDFDNDGDGLIDCADDNCATETYCEESESNCYDNFDNDGDGLIDCADTTCMSPNEQGMNVCWESECNDGFDNDLDGLIDCYDIDCSGKIFDTELCPSVDWNNKVLIKQYGKTDGSTINYLDSNTACQVATETFCTGLELYDINAEQWNSHTKPCDAEIFETMGSFFPFRAVCEGNIIVESEEDLDGDDDGIPDDEDNCPDDENPDQSNNDGDEFGDVCDTDDDNDGVLDYLDACPELFGLETNAGCPVILLGDVDCNNVVNMLDAIKIKSYVSPDGIDEFTKVDGEICETGESAADVDCNDVVNMLDAIKVKSYVSPDGIDQFTKVNGEICTG